MEPSEVGAALWRQRLLVLVVFVVTGLAVAVGVHLAPKTYVAEASVSAVAGPNAADDSSDLDAQRGTVASLADSRAVVLEVQSRIDASRTYDELRREISATWQPGTTLVTVTVHDRDGRVAADIANQVASALGENDPSGGALYYTVTDPARPPATYASPDLLVAAGVGFVVALVVAICVALLRDRRTNTVRSGAQVETAIGSPLLAHLPVPRHDDLPALEPGTPAADLFRRLRIAVEAEASADPTSVLVITGTGPGDVNAWLAANLAVSLAHTGRRTLLVDARLAGAPPVEHGPGTPGLADVLRGTRVDHAVSPGPVEHLEVMPAGAVGRQDHRAGDELLESGFGDFARTAVRDVDVMVVIAPSLHVSDDAVVLGASGSTVLVVTEGSVRPAELDRLARRLASSGTRLLGAVLVGRRGERGVS